VSELTHGHTRWCAAVPGQGEKTGRLDLPPTRASDRRLSARWPPGAFEGARQRALEVDASNVRTVQHVLERAAEVLPLRVARSAQELGVHQEARP